MKHEDELLTFLETNGKDPISPPMYLNVTQVWKLVNCQNMGFVEHMCFNDYCKEKFHSWWKSQHFQAVLRIKITNRF